MLHHPFPNTLLSNSHANTIRLAVANPHYQRTGSHYKRNILGEKKVVALPTRWYFAINVHRLDLCKTVQSTGLRNHIVLSTFITYGSSLQLDSVFS